MKTETIKSLFFCGAFLLQKKRKEKKKKSAFQKKNSKSQTWWLYFDGLGQLWTQLMKPWILLSNIPNIPLSPETQAHLRYAAGQRSESYQQVHLWIAQRNKNKIDVFEWPNINRLKADEGHSETSHSMNRPLGGGSGTMARHRPTNPQMTVKWGKRFLCHASETSALHSSHKIPYKMRTECDIDVL